MVCVHEPITISCRFLLQEIVYLTYFGLGLAHFWNKTIPLSCRIDFSGAVKAANFKVTTIEDPEDFHDSWDLPAGYDSRGLQVGIQFGRTVETKE